MNETNKDCFENISVEKFIEFVKAGNIPVEKMIKAGKHYNNAELWSAIIWTKKLSGNDLSDIREIASSFPINERIRIYEDIIFTKVDSPPSSGNSGIVCSPC